MPFDRSAFHRILEPLDRHLLSRAVERHDGNRGVGGGDGAWTCQRHLKALIFAHVTGARSLREIAAGLSAHPGGLYHLGLRPAKRATLSDASARRPQAVFRDVALALMERLGQRRTRQEGEALIRLVDGSPIPVRDGRFTWAQADSRCRGLKLHLVYDPRAVAPVQFSLEGAKTSELSVAHGLRVEAGATYVFDKGYTDYGWWQDLHANGARFVTRLKSNARRREVHERPVTGEGIEGDRTVKIGHRQPRGGAVNTLYDTPLQEVVVPRDGKTPLHLITNDHTRPAQEIAALYKERWQIELFFKWIKQNLKIKSFFGRSENAVRVQIYAALIAFCLLRLFAVRCGLDRSTPTKAILAQLKVALFSAFDTSLRAPPLPRPPALTPSSPQLCLAFR